MTPFPYTEDTLVQQTTAEYLEQKLGWQSVYAYNNEDFGPNSLLGRTSDREVVLAGPLRRKLAEFNPGLPDEAYDDAVRQIAAVTATQSLLATNREKYNLIRDGVQVSFRNGKGERVKERLRVLDFADPRKNDFLCVREFWVRGDLYRRRADIVGFVNGLPLLFMELKTVGKDIRVAYEKNFKDYKDTVPHLFHHNAIVALANGVEAKIGSVTSRFEHFHEWKRLAEDEPGVVDMETLLKGLYDKSNFIDLVENFILFDDSTGETKKILARNHQFLGVNRAVRAVGDLNKRIAAKLEELETADIDVAERLEQELKRDYHIITADKRLDQVARDFVEHYSKAWETGKAMLVCIDKITCVKMYNLIARYWDERIAGLTAELAAIKDKQEEQYRKRQIAWMRETKMAVVVSEEQGEVDKFRKWNLDITPHRRLIKNGMDLPERPCGKSRNFAPCSGWTWTRPSRKKSIRSASPSSAPCG